MVAFDARVEVAFDSGYSTAAASRNFTDVTSKVLAKGSPFTITRGRQDDRSAVAPSTLQGVVLDNTDGRFTPELVSGANYPNVKKGRPIRVRVRYPSTQAGNYATANQASVETSAADWAFNVAFGTYDVGTSVAQTAVRAVDGTKSVLATWATTVKGHWVGTPVSGLTIGRSYTASLYVYAPTGSPDPRLDVLFVGTSARTSTKDAFVRLSVTFTATAATQFVGVQVASATAGQTCYIDALMVDDATVPLGAFTTAAVPMFERFLGYVDEWDVAWPDGGSLLSTCTVSATSRTARLATSASLRSLIEQEYAVDAPLLQFTLGEDTNATQAGNSSTTPQNPLSVAQAGVGGTLTFGTGTGPATDSLPAVQLTPASAGNGQYLAASLLAPLAAYGDHTLAFDICFNTSTVAAQTLVLLWADANNYLLLGIDGTGKLFARIAAIDGTGTARTATATSAGSVANGATHHGALRCVLNDGTGQATVSVVTDGVVVSAAAVAWPTWVGITFFPAFANIAVGGSPAGIGSGSISTFTGTLAQLGAYMQSAAANAMTDARLQAHSNAALTGFSGETAQSRIARYASYLGVPTAEQSLETGLLLGVCHVDTTGASAVDLMQRVAVTSEDGLLFDGRDGALTFQARSHRYNVSSALTLDVAAQEVQGDFAPKLDDQGVLNDVTASRPGGISVRSTNAASIADLGYYRATPEILTTSDGEVQSAADWKVSRLGTPRMKAPALSVDLMTFPTAGKIATILGIELGTKVTVSNLPAQAQASSLDLFVEGTKETIGIAAWDISWNTSAVLLSNVWQLDSASFSQLDSTTVLAY